MIFINQSTGELFSDIIDVLRQFAGPHFLVAGNNYRLWDNVRLLKCCDLKRSSSIKRMQTWGMFTLQCFYHLLFHARKQHLLFVTNPPMTMWMAPFFKRFYRCRYSLLIYDIYPDALIAAGRLSGNSIFAILWRKINCLVLRGAENVITLGDGMAETLRKQVRDGEDLKVTVIENWVDIDFFKPVPKSKNPIIQELNLNNKLIVAYAGSFGATHGVLCVLDCAERLTRYSGIHFLLIGGGTEENRIRQSVSKVGLTNLTVLPFQPKERFRYLAAAADVSLVLTKAGAGQAIMPSKTFTALSAGSVVLAAAEAGSDVSRLVKRHECGLVVPPEDSKGMADSILRLAKNPQEIFMFKNNARCAAVKFYDKKTQCRKYVGLFDDVAP